MDLDESGLTGGEESNGRPHFVGTIYCYILKPGRRAKVFLGDLVEFMGKGGPRRSEDDRMRNRRSWIMHIYLQQHDYYL